MGAEPAPKMVYVSDIPQTMDNLFPNNGHMFSVKLYVNSMVTAEAFEVMLNHWENGFFCTFSLGREGGRGWTNTSNFHIPVYNWSSVTAVICNSTQQTWQTTYIGIWIKYIEIDNWETWNKN